MEGFFEVDENEEPLLTKTAVVKILPWEGKLYKWRMVERIEFL